MSKEFPSICWGPFYLWNPSDLKGRSIRGTFSYADGFQSTSICLGHDKLKGHMVEWCRYILSHYMGSILIMYLSPFWVFALTKGAVSYEGRWNSSSKFWISLYPCLPTTGYSSKIWKSDWVQMLAKSGHTHSYMHRHYVWWWLWSTVVQLTESMWQRLLGPKCQTHLLTVLYRQSLVTPCLEVRNQRPRAQR